jgi:hypothetical protein
MCELLHTSPVVQKMMGYPKSKSVTVVTATEAQARQAAWAADTEACFAGCCLCLRHKTRCAGRSQKQGRAYLVSINATSAPRRKSKPRR